MKLVIQKVSSASVEVEEKCCGKNRKGFLVFLGVGQEEPGRLQISISGKW